MSRISRHTSAETELSLVLRQLEELPPADLTVNKIFKCEMNTATPSCKEATGLPLCLAHAGLAGSLASNRGV